MMLFSGLKFLFCFFPAFLAAYYCTPKKYRNLTLLLGSLLFYLLTEPDFAALLLFMVFLNYGIARQISRLPRDRCARRFWLFLGVLVNAGLLAAFKALVSLSDSLWLPLGLSFYLFKMLSFLADIYRGEISQMPSFLNSATYFTMFPQITSGPVMRYREGAFSPSGRACSPEMAEEGTRLFVLGLALKILLADRLLLLWQDIHTIGYESISTPLSWLGAGAYSMRLYFDFWGYSLMSSGICVMLGLPFIRNFRHPYASGSIREFWRRWHMTLGSFFRDYVYIPLGGSRKGAWRTMGNLFFVWILTGFWHGEGIHFILWGLGIFCFLLLEKFLIRNRLESHPFLARFYVLLVISVTWVIFAIPDREELFLYLGRMFPFMGGNGGISVNPRDFVKFLRLYGHYLALGVLACIPAVSAFYEKHKKHPLMTAALAVVFWLCVYCVIHMGSNPFAYLKF